MGCRKQHKLLHLFIPSKTSTLVPKFVVEDLPLGRTASLVPEFAVKDLMMMIDIDIVDHLCGVIVNMSDYQSRGFGFDSWLYPKTFSKNIKSEMRSSQSHEAI